MLEQKAARLELEEGRETSSDMMDRLCKYIYSKDNTDRLQTRAIQCHIYNYAIHDSWYQAYSCSCPCSSILPILLLAASPSLPFSSCASLPLTDTNTSPTLSSLLFPRSSPSHFAIGEVSSPSPSWSTNEVAWNNPGQEGSCRS